MLSKSFMDNGNQALSLIVLPCCGMVYNDFTALSIGNPSLLSLVKLFLPTKSFDHFNAIANCFTAKGYLVAQIGSFDNQGP